MIKWIAFVESLDTQDFENLKEAIDDICLSKADFIASLPEPNEREVRLVANGQWVVAVREYRTRTNCSLTCAKEKIDNYR